MLPNTAAIITEFETLIGSATELSSDDELKLLNKIYFQVLRQKAWEFLKKEASGTISGTDITQPADFFRMADEPVIYIGQYHNPFKLIPFTERRLYTNQNNNAYYDARQEKFVFFRTQNDTYTFDYLYTPDALTTSGSDPVFPQQFWGMLPFLMASDADAIELTDKARSYAIENKARGNQILTDMEIWNDALTMMTTYGS